VTGHSRTFLPEANSKVSIMITEPDLTPLQRATLSNSICGDAGPARELERLGLVMIRRYSQYAGRPIAFFDLTPAGEAYVNKHFVVPDRASSPPPSAP
jgi:hypothetical protein